VADLFLASQRGFSNIEIICVWLLVSSNVYGVQKVALYRYCSCSEETLFMNHHLGNVQCALNVVDGVSNNFCIFTQSLFAGGPLYIELCYPGVYNLS